MRHGPDDRQRKLAILQREMQRLWDTIEFLEGKFDRHDTEENSDRLEAARNAFRRMEQEEAGLLHTGAMRWKSE